MAQCGYIREELRECLQQSPCLAKHGLTFHECLKRINDKEEPSNDFIPVRCFLLREALFSCRRGMLDMRKRFRGNIDLPPVERLPSADELSRTSS